MPHVRALRRSHGLTLTELALLIRVPARTLAEIEYGLEPLDPDTRSLLAAQFGLAPDLLRSGRTPAAGQAWAGLRQTAPFAVAGVLSAAIMAPELAAQQRQLATLPFDLARSAVQSQLARPARALGAGPSAFRALPQPATATATAAPTATPLPPTATPPPPSPTPERFVLLPDGPHGCPLANTPGQIVITQGYGVGTHAPANVWGALDLAIDGNGDGVAEPDTTFGVAVVATHHGVARVFPGSWPGGNFVQIENPEIGWTTAYGHLDTILVAEGQAVAAGDQVGTVGSTGMSYGPHLHYEVRAPHGNIDPAPLVNVDCRM